MNYQKFIAAGNATRDAEYKLSKDGEVGYTNLTVAVNDSQGNVTYFPVTVFGKQAEATASGNSLI